MTVKEAVSVLMDATKLYIGWDSSILLINTRDELMMDAFGSYRVKRIINGVEDNAVEIHIADAPIKEVQA